jgi:hypothetical protein
MPYGYHWSKCPGSGNGGGGAAAAVLAVLAVIIAAIAKPVANAADAVLRVAVDALEILVIVLVSAAGLAALAGMAYGALRVYRWHARNRQAIPRHTSVAQRASWALSAPRRRPIGAPKAVIRGLVIRDETRERR